MNQSEEKQLKEAWEINAELMAGLEVGAGKNKKLRELNAELLKTLRAIAITAESSSSVALWAREAIAKAEALK